MKAVAVKLSVFAVLLASIMVPVLADGAAAEGSVTPDSTLYRYTPTFTVTSDDWESILYVSWDFGDGSVLDGRWNYYKTQDESTLTDEQKAGIAQYDADLAANGGNLFVTTHTYAEPGIFTVTMVVMNPMGYIAPDQTEGYDGSFNTDDTGYDGGLTSSVASDITKPSEEDFSDAEFRAVAGAWHRTVCVVEVLGYPTVTFDSNGGSDVSALTVENGSTYTAAQKPADPVKNGYAFTGWYTDEDCTVAYDWDTLVTEPITLYAGWTEATVVYYVDGQEASVFGPKTVADVTIPTKDGYTFNGWYSDSECKIPVENTAAITNGMTLYSDWTKNTVTVTVDGKDIVFDEGTKVSQITKPTKEGYTFSGWYSDAKHTVSVEDTTILNDGMALYSGWTEIPTVYYVDGQKASFTGSKTVADVTVPVREGFEFAGWYSDAGCTVPVENTAVIVAGMTLYSKFTEKIADVKITVDGKETVVPVGTKVSDLAVPESDKEFKGWYSDEKCTVSVDNSTVLTDGMTLYSCFAEDEKTTEIPIAAIAVCVFGALIACVGVRYHPAILVFGALVLVFGFADVFGFIEVF